MKYFLHILFFFCSLSFLKGQYSPYKNQKFGSFHAYLADFEKSLLENDQTISKAIKEFGSESAEVATLYQKQAALYLFYKNDKKALLYYHKSEQMLRELFSHSPFFPDAYAESLEAIGQIYQNQENWDKSLSFYQNALHHRLQKARYNQQKDSIHILQKYHQIKGDWFLAQNKTEAAQEVFQPLLKKALKEKEAYDYPSDIPLELNDRISNLQLKLAQIFEKQGQHQKAIAWYKKGTTAHRGILGEVDLYKAKGFYQLAILSRDLDEKVRFVQKAIALHTLDYQKTSPRTNPEKVENILDRPQALSCLNLKIFLLISKWQTQRHDLRWLELALKTCRVADHLIARIRRDLADNPNEKEAQLPYFLMTYEQGIEISQILYRETGQASYFDEAYFFTERNKAILLSEAKTVANAFASATIPDSVLQKKQQLEQNIKILSKKYDHFLIQGDSAQALHFQNTSLFPVIRESDIFNHQLKNTYSYYLSKQFDVQVPPVDSIQKMLDEKTLIIEYAMNEVLDEYIYEEDRRRLYIYTLGQQDLSITVAPWNIKLDEQIAAFYKLLQKTSIVRSKRKKRFIELSHQLYQSLIQPIEPYLEGIERVIFVGEDQLNYIPFEVLLKNKSTTDFQNMSYLLEDFEISYHYSSTLLYDSYSQKNAPKINGLLAFAPVFNEDISSSALASRSDTTYQYLRSGQFQPLIWTKQEVGQIDSLFQNQNIAQKQLLLESAANKNALIQQLEQPYQYIHLATHSFADLENPDSSGVACFPINADTPKSPENILYLHEIYPLDIQADLVALSSCESGVGKLQLGEGMLGLNRGFIYAGAPNVLFSLWKVNDKITAEFMLIYYEAVLAGDDFSTALRKAKLDLLGKKTSALPVYWSAFQLIGWP